MTVQAKFTAATQELQKAKILKRELNERASRHTHFELKNITFDENKFPYGWLKTAMHGLQYILLFNGNTQMSAAPELRRLLSFLPPCAALNRGRRLFGKRRLFE